MIELDVLILVARLAYMAGFTDGRRRDPKQMVSLWKNDAGETVARFADGHMENYGQSPETKSKGEL